MSKDEELRRNTDQILQGIRIVLPGTQAVMGFQFIAFFNTVFLGLSTTLKTLHFVALALSIVCSIFLIAPVAFQQIGEEGEATRRFLKFTRKMLSAAMFFLLSSVAIDVYIAAQVMRINSKVALVISVLLFMLGLFLWYGYAVIKREQSSKK